MRERIGRAISLIRRLRPHMVDPWAFGVVIVTFGLGVLLLTWHGASLRLEIEGAHLAWVVLVAFGLSWHGELGSGWRLGAGMVFGAFVAIAAYYGTLSRLPVTPLAFGLALGLSAALLALVCHALPRAFAFAGAVVGFGVGVAAATSFPLRPTTPADDLLSLMLTVALCLIVGVFGSMALRAVLLRMGVPSAREAKLIRLPQRRRAHAGTTGLRSAR